MARFNRRYKPRRKYAAKGKRVYKKKSSMYGKVRMLQKQVRQIKMHEEVKSIQYPISERGLSTYYNGNDGSSYTMRLHQLSPNASTLPIALGTTSSSRVGNRISIVNGRIKLTFWSAAQNSETNPYPVPCIVRGWILTKRNTANGEPPSSLPSFFQSGSTAINPSGYLQDDFNVINKDLYRVYKQFKVKIGNSSFEGTGGSSINNFFANNDYALTKTISINFTKHLIKNCKFNDSSTDPTTRGLWLAMECLSGNNVGQSVGAQPISYLAEVSLSYKDT